MVYIEAMKMDKAVQIRMPLEMWEHLAKLAKERGPGTKVTALIREAVHKNYFGGDLEGGSSVPPTPVPPPEPYPISEITALRAAEAPKKSTGR